MNHLAILFVRLISIHSISIFCVVSCNIIIDLIFVLICLILAELQRDTKAEDPEAPEKPLIEPVDKRKYIFCRYCYTGDHTAKFCPQKHYICRDCGTLFPCEKKNLHGEEHKVLNYCFDCKQWGHLREMCPDLDEENVDFDPPYDYSDY